MSNIIVEVGPPLELGMFESIRANVTAVGTSPSLSTRSNVPVGKNGKINVKLATNIFGNEYTTEICSKIVAASWKDAKKATCLPRISSAFSMNMFGYPSGNLRHLIVPSSTASARKSTPRRAREQKEFKEERPLVSYKKRHNAWERKPKTCANEKSAKERERTWIVRLHFSRHLFHVWAVKQYFLHRSSLGLARHSFELLRSFLHRFRFQNVSFFQVFSLSLSLFATFTKNPPTTRGTRAEGLFSRVSFVCSLSSLARWSKASSSSCKAVPFMCLKETPLWWACLGFYTWRVFERGKHPTVGKGQHNFERRSFLYEWCHKIHTGKQHKT